MSVVNIAVLSDRIMILTDTLVYEGRAPIALCERKGGISKAGGFITATRGARVMGDRIREVNDTITDLDDAVEIWREALVRIPVEHHGDGGVTELVMAGFSEARCRLAALMLRTEVRDGTLHVTENEFGQGIHLNPEFPGRVAAMLPKTADDSVMQRIAVAQWRVQEKFSLPLCVGGVMRLFDLTANGAAERIIGTYPDYGQHARQFGDPNAAAVLELSEVARAA